MEPFNYLQEALNWAFTTADGDCSVLCEQYTCVYYQVLAAFGSRAAGVIIGVHPFRGK